MKILLAGSPKIAIKTFEKVIENFDVVGILTQPDRKKGRGMKMQETEVATLGRKHNIKVFKSDKIIGIYEEIKSLNYDILLTFAFGQWIPPKILKLGKFKPVNIHGSLLPKYRGAAPIHYAILNGDSEIGITLIEMVKKMDAGDMLFQASIQIKPTTTTGEGIEIISKLAEENIVKWLKEIKKGDVKFTPQGEYFTESPKIEKSFTEITPLLTKKEVLRKVKGLNPTPGAYIYLGGKRLKLFDVSPTPYEGSIEFNTKDGFLYAIDFQWESKARRKI